jgi:hypothetical protein
MDYGMFTDQGNLMIHVLVNTAKAKNLTLDQAYNLLISASEIPGFEEATDTVVRENFFTCLGYYDVA